MITLIERANYGTVLVKVYLEDRLMDVWECRSTRTSIMGKHRENGKEDSVLNIVDTPEGYKMCLEHGGQVQEAILCEKVYVHIGVTI
jgi:hypothetical protein